MRLVRATENRTGQTESCAEMRRRCGVGDCLLDLILLIRSSLESGIREGDNPVEERRKAWQYLEYCSSDIEQEVRGHQPLTLNTMRVR